MVLPLVRAHILLSWLVVAESSTWRREQEHEEVSHRVTLNPAVSPGWKNQLLPRGNNWTDGKWCSCLYPSRNKKFRELTGLQRQLEYLWNTLDENDRKFYTCSVTALVLLADAVAGMQVPHGALSLLGAFGFCSWDGTEISVE